MKVEKVAAGVNFYVCESEATQYREAWHDKIAKEIKQFLQLNWEETPLLRGVSKTQDPDDFRLSLEEIAQLGLDQYQPYIGLDQYQPYKGCLTYVVSIHNLNPAFDRAGAGILLYRASALSEQLGDKGQMGVEFNRFKFLVEPKEALLGIIDLREVRQKSKELDTWSSLKL